MQAAEFDEKKRVPARIAIGDIVANTTSFDVPDEGVVDGAAGYEPIRNRYVIGPKASKSEGVKSEPHHTFRIQGRFCLTRLSRIRIA